MLKLWENTMLSIGDRLKVAIGEINRLNANVNAAMGYVKEANARAEHFEREWYLRGDALEDIVETRASLHGTERMMLDRCLKIAAMALTPHVD